MIYLTAMPEGEGPGREHHAGWALLRLGLIELGFPGAGEDAQGLMGRALKGEHGKPYLPGGPEFSISHSRGLIGCAVGPAPMGLDIERVREFTPGMKERICTEGELLLTGGGNSLLTQLWTCKESYMKLTGLGFSQGIRETELRSLGERPEMAGESGARFYSRGIKHAGHEFWLTLCSMEPPDFGIQWTDYRKL